MKIAIIILAVASIVVVSARGQGFENLNFESAQNLPANPDGRVLVSVANALPDWAAFAGPNTLSSIYYVTDNNGSSSLVQLEGGSAALSGNNLSVGLYVGGLISQTGLVPGNAESLQFEATGYEPFLQVTLGGQLLSYTTVSEGPDYTVYGVNIPAGMAGQTETLTFGMNGSQTLLDDIEFLPTSVVPEPSEGALLGLGAMLFALCRWRNQHL